MTTIEHGWATQTFEMTLQADGITLVSHFDFTDPKRSEQTFEYQFIRGVWYTSESTPR